MARPTDFTQEMGDRICEGLAIGRSLRSMCMQDDMPGLSTVYQWFRKFPEFAENYARAREDQADTFADELVSIADDASDDYVNRQREDGSTYVAIDHDHINRARLRVDTRKWIASKLKSKNYGDRVEATLKGDAASPLTVQIMQFSPDKA